MDDFEGARLYNLFPERVVATCLQRDVTQQEIDHAVGAIGQRGINVLDADPMKDLREFISTELDRYMKNVIAPRNEVSLRLTMSWSANARDENIMRRNNSYVSGMLFLDADKSAEDVIEFFKPQDGGHLYIPTYSPNAANMPMCSIGTDKGYLFLFSSLLAHRATANGTYIAFNTFPVGWIGDAGEPDSFWV